MYLCLGTGIFEIAWSSSSSSWLFRGTTSFCFGGSVWGCLGCVEISRRPVREARASVRGCAVEVDGGGDERIERRRFEVKERAVRLLRVCKEADIAESKIREQRSGLWTLDSGLWTRDSD